MTTQHHFDADDAKIVPLFPAEEQQASAALSRYWDATVSGQRLDISEIDPELKAVVQLLRHYHAVTRHQPGAQALLRSPNNDLPLPPERAIANTGRHPQHAHASRAALTMVGVFLLLFTFNTVVSPRSWLLTRTTDPDWIPWVSDDWLGFSL